MKTRAIVLTGLLLLAAVPMFAAYDAFMLIDGLNGNSKLPGRQGWFEINSFSYGPSSRGISATGAGAGKVSLHDITITKRTDASSPTLFRSAVMTGRVFRTVTLELHGERTTLQDVVITSIQPRPGPQGQESEVIHMTFARDVTHQSPGGPNVTGKWNLKNAEYLKVKTFSNATITGDGSAPAAIILRSVRLLGQNRALIVVCDAPGGQGVASLQRAFQLRLKMPMLMVATRATDSTYKPFVPAVQFNFSTATITGNTPGDGGCSQFSLKFEGFSGPPAGYESPSR